MYVAVFSPKYQAFPALSSAYQSHVFSAIVLSSARRRTSSTTVVVTPWIFFVQWVIVSRSRNRWPPSLPR